jgi:hypothetical protein
MRDPLRLGVNGFSSSTMRASAVSGRINVQIPSGEEQVFVREIVSNESVGHGLKKLGLPTRRLGSEGLGLVLDTPTQIRIHQLSLAYDVLPDACECGHCHNLQASRAEERM